MGNRTYALALSQQGGGGVQLIRLSPASVTGVTTALPDGVYAQGSPIRITVEFDEPVSVSGPPPSLLLAFDDGRSRAAEYASGSGTRSLEFSYAVQPGDNVARLDYAGTAALTTRGVVTDMQAASAAAVTPSTAADLELPPLGVTGSLGHNQSIAVDTRAPRVQGVAAAGGPLGVQYRVGGVIEIAVSFDEPVELSGPAPDAAARTRRRGDRHRPVRSARRRWPDAGLHL